MPHHQLEPWKLEPLQEHCAWCCVLGSYQRLSQVAQVPCRNLDHDHCLFVISCQSLCPSPLCGSAPVSSYLATRKGSAKMMVSFWMQSQDHRGAGNVRAQRFCRRRETHLAFNVRHTADSAPSKALYFRGNNSGREIGESRRTGSYGLGSCLSRC